MPELPEVETIVQDLNKKILEKKIKDVFCDTKKMILNSTLGNFKKAVVGAKIKKIRRRAKYILINLDNKKSLVIHLRMTGHLLVKNQKSNVKNQKYFYEEVNQYIHFKLIFKDNSELAFSDLRKFGTIKLVDTKDVFRLPEIKNLGPEPLDPKFNYLKFKKALENYRGAIKPLLLSQRVVAGLGNIYTDESLWRAKIHPRKPVAKFKEKDFKNLFKVIKLVLKKAVRYRGTSVAEFRDTGGKKGNYQNILKVYRRAGENCPRCQTRLKRIKVAQRGTHFCPRCQPLGKA